MRILCNPDNSEELISYADERFWGFMEQASAPLLYGDPVIVYNVCGLLHLTEDVRRLKPLHSFSSFSLNNYLESLKRMVHSWSRALAEVSKRKNTQLSFSTK